LDDDDEHVVAAVGIDVQLASSGHISCCISKLVSLRDICVVRSNSLTLYSMSARDIAVDDVDVAADACEESLF